MPKRTRDYNAKPNQPTKSKIKVLTKGKRYDNINKLSGESGTAEKEKGLKQK